MGAVPVFVDVDLSTYNIDVSLLESALTDKTKAVMLAHTLGNPFDLATVKKFCNDNNLWLIEDCCDALGSTFDGKHVGTFGDIGTLSFYPAHHITTGEGGALFTNNGKLRSIAESFRDWGEIAIVKLVKMIHVGSDSHTAWDHCPQDMITSISTAISAIISR